MATNIFLSRKIPLFLCSIHHTLTCYYQYKEVAKLWLYIRYAMHNKRVNVARQHILLIHISPDI